MRRAVERYPRGSSGRGDHPRNLHENDPIHVTVDADKLAFHQDKPSEATRFLLSRAAVRARSDQVGRDLRARRMR